MSKNKNTEPANMTTRTLALVAHDRMKSALVAWCKQHHDKLQPHQLYATGSTGQMLETALSIPIHKLESGPLGGDQQIGAMIVDGSIDVLIFFWDPLEAQPHDPDVRALLRIAAVWNIPVACNPATADYLIFSTLLSSNYRPARPDFSHYRERNLPS